jgi:hypothetical protein
LKIGEWLNWAIFLCAGLCSGKSDFQLWQSLNFGKVIRESILKTAENRKIERRKNYEPGSVMTHGFPALVCTLTSQ